METSFFPLQPCHKEQGKEKVELKPVAKTGWGGGEKEGFWLYDG